MENNVYWLEEDLITGFQQELPSTKDITIIGSGLTGASCAYWLAREGGYSVNLIDDLPQKAASFRNWGHILSGTVESMYAFTALHGQDKAKEVWQFSQDSCDQIEETIKQENFSCDYKKDGYLVVAIDKNEDEEIKKSISLLNKMGFASDYKMKEELEFLGLKKTYGARFDKNCAQLHPVKFRNELLRYALKKGLNYFSGKDVLDLKEKSESVQIKTKQGDFESNCVILATNAYSTPFFQSLNKKAPLVPFKGQIICSTPLKEKIKISYPHSFDHGYEFALRTEDNRLMIGGWRNNVKGQEIGKTDLKLSHEVEKGLKNFVREYYNFSQEPEWVYSWAGVMASSNSSLPVIGPLASNIFACLAYTGHGASWSHNCSKVLCDIILGNSYSKASRFFRP